jgi:DNA-binding CsgD family transcriptional regulator
MNTSLLTIREQEILTLVAYEYSSREIAEKLYISSSTVITHRKNLMAKMEVKNTAGLVRKAFESGVLGLESILK